MSPERRPRRAAPRRSRSAAGASGPVPAPLLAKYRALLDKHQALLGRERERVEGRASVFRLAVWALNTTQSALALVREGTVLIGNACWHRLNRVGMPAWRPVEDGGAPARSLRQVTLHEASRLEAGHAATTRLCRYAQVGEEGRVLQVRSERVRSGRERLVLVLALDITEQVQAERELARTRQALLEREHLRALGEMAAGIAHDLSGTLGAMRLRLDVLGDNPGVDAGQLAALHRIVSDASDRVRALQSFARQEPEPVAEAVELHAVAWIAAELIRPELERQARLAGHVVRLDVDVPVLPRVRASAMELRFVLINLILNARDAMPRGGTIRVRGQRRGHQVMLTVEDEGSGIPPEHLTRVFEPFFTTKEGRGTGLGLSIAYGVARRAGGTIRAANRSEGGALLTLTLPAATAPVGAPLPESAAAPAGRLSPPVAPAPRRQRRPRAGADPG